MINGEHLSFVVQHPPLGPVAGDPYVMSLLVASRGARTAVFDWQLPERVEWIDERCVAKGGNVWRCTLSDLASNPVVTLQAHLIAPLSNARQTARADLISSDPPESREFAHLFTIWPRSPGDLVAYIIPFETTDAEGNAELRIELETRRAPLNASEVRVEIDGRMRVLEMQLPAGWSCEPEPRLCRAPVPALGEKVTVVLKVDWIEASQFVAVRLTWSDRGFGTEERTFRASFPVYVHEMVVTNTNDSGPGSLRQAMLDARSGRCESFLSRCRIRFDIPPPRDGAWLTIRPESPLPDLHRVTIDGTTQTRRRDTNLLGPEIELDGSRAGGGDGLTVRASGGGAAVKGLAIHSFPGSGIEAGGATVIDGNYIGTDATGQLARPNGSRGVTIAGHGVEVANNVISGNFRSGVFSLSGSGTIHDNLIGLAADGVTPLPNGASGIFGGPSATLSIENNAIAYNAHFGIGILRAEEGSVLLRTSVVARANLIFGNAIAAIDQGLDGPGSSTPAPAPVITSATYDPVTDSTVIRGSIVRRSDNGFYSYTVHLHASASPSPSGFGDGEQYLGAMPVAGTTFTFRMKGKLTGRFISAHLVRFWNWAELSETVTSEFGNVVEVR